MTYFVYIVECNDGTLYTGSTNDVEKRIHTHNTSKNAARYTKNRRPVVLKYVEMCVSKSDALKKEIFIKKKNREEKLELIHMHKISL